LIVVDTSIAVDFLRGDQRAKSALRSQLSATESLGMSAVTLFELLNPIYHRKQEAQEKVVKSFAHQMRLLPIDSSAAEESAKIMGALLRTGKQVNALDVLIAGSAVANGAEKIISKDRDYERIGDVSALKVEIIE